MTRLEVMIQSLNRLKEQYEQAKKDGELDEDYWWEDEYGYLLTDGISCHVVYKGDPPCLCEERGLFGRNDLSMDERIEQAQACAECKAIWLMGEYE